MSRFADIQKGTRARKPITLELSGDATIEIAVRPLNGAELGTVIARARAYAVAQMEAQNKAAGIDRALPEPKAGDPLYDLGMMAATLLLACSDPKSPEAAPVPMFASAEEILTGLDPDRIALLYEQQQLWQEHCSPRPRHMDGGDAIAWAMRLAEEDASSDDSPFVKLAPSLRLSWARTISGLFLTSLRPKSSPSSPNEAPPSPPETGK